MKVTFVVLATSVALASAQGTGLPTYNSTTGKFDCPISNGAYCAGTSLQTDIIIRCADGVGQPGNCNDNLDGEPPIGDDGQAICWASSPTSGIAACAKNCVVYGGSGDANGTFTLSGCTPYYTASSSSSTVSLTTSSTPASSPTTSCTTTTPSSSAPTTTSASSTISSYANSTASSPTTSPTITITSTGCSTHISGGTTTVITFTTTYCPTTSATAFLTTTSSIPLSTGVSGGSGGTTHTSNGTYPTSTSGGSGSGGSGGSSGATNTPVGPTTTSSATGSGYTNGAIQNSGSALAALGLALVYFL